MKKNDLMTGDIVVMRSGILGVVIRSSGENYLMYQNNGWESLEDYDDDMNWIYASDEDSDAVMQVFRNEYGAIGFNDFEDIDPIYERDYTWTRPSEEELAKAEAAAQARREATAVELNERAAHLHTNQISIIAQAFYGNRTGTEIRVESMDRFILGYQTDDISITEPFDRTVIRLPGSDSLVLVYNKYKEEERRTRKEEAWVKDQYVIKPLASIPEMDLEIYSRCIACRMTASGEFQSVEDEDLDILGKYLAK